MAELWQAYRTGQGPIPAEMWAWPLYGAGLENLGRGQQPVRWPVPMPDPEELLARIDAVGLCFSDVKLIRAGGSHPRLYGRDLAADPTVPGHEVSLTVVRVGDRLRDQFAPGQRFVVQADVYFRGVNLAFGYMLRGGLAQYALIGQEILRGDAGCYLIPIRGEVGYAETALTEPWACIEASYRIRYRPGLKPGGTALFLGSGSRSDYRLSGQGWPARAFLAEMPPQVEEQLQEQLVSRGTEVVHLEEAPEAICQAGSLDDILVLDALPARRLQALIGCLARGGVLALLDEALTTGQVGVDVGRVHYDDIRVVGSVGPDLTAGYRVNTRSELKAGGRVWFLGAGGPMGQMQVQRALEMADGPGHILATNLRSGRIVQLATRFQGYAARQGRELRCLTREEVGEEGYWAAIREMAGEEGFDDIIILAPSVEAIAEAAGYLAPGGVLNIFAGLSRGTLVPVPLGELLAQGVRIVGSSGSSVEDLEYTLRKAERGELNPNGSVAAVSGIEGVWEGIQAVAEGRFPGKVVVYPQIEGLGLTPLEELQRVLPQVTDRLEDGVWTPEAERELICQKWGRG